MNANQVDCILDSLIKFHSVELMLYTYTPLLLVMHHQKNIFVLYLNPKNLSLIFFVRKRNYSFIILGKGVYSD